MNITAVADEQTFEPIRVGVVGGGLVAQVVHLPYLAELGSRFRVEALADPSRHVGDGLARRYRIPAVFADHRQLLDRATLDAVIVCSPNGTHADVVIDALEAGLHVLVEKPLCISPADAQRIVAARERTGLVVQVGYMKRFDPAYEALLSDLPGAGALRHVTSVTYDPGLSGPFAPADMVVADDVPTTVAAELAQRTAEQVEEAVGTGEPEDVSTFVEGFLGALVHDVNAVAGVLDGLALRDRMRVADAFASHGGALCGGSIELSGGVRWSLAWLRIDALHDFHEQIAVYAADGVRTLDFPAPYLRQAPTVYTRSCGVADHNERRQLRSWRESYLRELIHFGECITGGASCRTPPEQARDDIELLTGMFSSHLAHRESGVRA